MGIEVKIPKTDEQKSEYALDKEYYEEFRKKWEIATSRLKPYLNGNHTKTINKSVVKSSSGMSIWR